jgi:PAS domain S-box-containing protein
MIVSSLSSLSLHARNPYTIALVGTIAAGLAGLALTPLTHDFHAVSFSLLYLAILLSCWYGGVRHALLASLIASLFANYHLSASFRHFQVGPRELMRTGLWLGFSGALAYVLCRLRQDEVEAQKVLASIVEGFCVFDSDWNFVYINKAGAGLAGMSRAEIVGKNLWEAFPALRGTLLERQYRLCARERVAVQFEHFFTQPGRIFQLRAYPSADSVSVFFQDISASKEKEAKLREVVERLLSANRAARIGTWEWNVQTDQVFWSSEIPGFHGMSPEQFDGRLNTWIKTVHPQDVPLVRARLCAALKNKQDYHSEFRVQWPNGETRWICCHGQVIEDGQGRAARMLGITSDITERRLEEEALRRSEKLAAAGKLAATIAHEMNNPLEALTNLLYLTRQDGGIKKETQDLLRLADQQLSRVNYIAKQTLGFYGELTTQSVNAVEVLDELIAIYQSRISGKDVRLEKHYHGDYPVKTPAAELRQALSGLLANAIDVSPTGARLILRIQPDALREKERTAVRIDVEDFGPGIPPADQPHIFEPFFTTKSYVGTGLGLWITRQLVQKRGGRIEFRSSCEPGNSGTCFSLILPAGKSRAPAVEKDEDILEDEVLNPAPPAV